MFLWALLKHLFSDRLPTWGLSQEGRVSEASDQGGPRSSCFGVFTPLTRNVSHFLLIDFRSQRLKQTLEARTCLLGAASEGAPGCGLGRRCVGGLPALTRPPRVCVLQQEENQTPVAQTASRAHPRPPKALRDTGSGPSKSQPISKDRFCSLNCLFQCEQQLCLACV